MPSKSPAPSPASPIAAAAPEAPPQPARRGERRIQTRRSAVHGNGVFAVQDIAEGERVIEYKGEVISWKEALRRHPHDPAQPNHTFYFHVDDKRVIDGGVHGNAARWINHSCEPNCEADEHKGRIYVKALRNIAAGEELSYDYGLVIDEPYTPELLADFPCWCGTPNCRGTLLSPQDEGDVPGRSPKKKHKKAAAAEGAGKKKKDKKKKAKGKKAGKARKEKAAA
jgi:hypothetical protein